LIARYLCYRFSSSFSFYFFPTREKYVVLYNKNKKHNLKDPKTEQSSESPPKSTGQVHALDLPFSSPCPVPELEIRWVVFPKIEDTFLSFAYDLAKNAINFTRSNESPTIIVMCRKDTN
jgi:hypothetical protein